MSEVQRTFQLLVMEGEQTASEGVLTRIVGELSILMSAMSTTAELFEALHKIQALELRRGGLVNA
jgi:hypothetical protein